MGSSQLSTRSLRQMLCNSHIKIWNLANHSKNITKNIKMLDLLMKNWKLRVWCSLFHFFHVICKIPNFDILWTVKHLAKASCTEFQTALEIHKIEAGLEYAIVDLKPPSPVSQYLLKDFVLSYSIALHWETS